MILESTIYLTWSFVGKKKEEEGSCCNLTKHYNTQNEEKG